MKKTYMTPDMEVVKINAQQQLLAGSGDVLNQSLDNAENMPSGGNFGTKDGSDLFGSEISTLLNW